MSVSIKFIKQEPWHFLGRFNPMKKTQKNRRFFIPIAMIKIVLVLLVLHFFFSSCESILYNGELYSDGPLVEVPAIFGDENQVYYTGDTVYLDIIVNNLTLEDRLSGIDVVLNDAEFHTEFAFVNDEGVSVFPNVISQGIGRLDSTSTASFLASFGLQTNTKGLLMATGNVDRPHLKLGFVFNVADDYTFYFVNTPNSWMDGAVDIFYDLMDSSSLGIKQAYANYLFSTEASNSSSEVLRYAGSEFAIVNFKVYKHN